MTQTVHMPSFARNDKIIRRNFYRYLLPSLLTVAATSLNEFMDSIVIAQILGKNAMSMVNMASPVMLVYSTVCVLLGIGGSTVYASFKGSMEKAKASSAFSLSLLIAGGISILLFAAGFCFLKPITSLLSNGLVVPAEFTEYVRILVISAPFIILLQTLLMFFPAEGKPQTAMLLIIIANVFNIFFDIFYTTVCQMGVAGAAFATLTGYVVAILVLCGMIFGRKCSLPFGKITTRDLSFLKEILSRGAGGAIGQTGLFVKVLFSNQIAALYAGSTGIAIFSACNQTVSMISVFLGGLLNAMIPLLAVLHSQEDHHGIRLLMKNVVRTEGIASLALFVLLETFPVQVLHLYGITDAAEMEAGITALRIFSFMYLFRQTVMIFLYYAQTVGRKGYAVILGIIEGFAGILVLAALFTRLWGITGLWLSYPVCSILLMTGIFLVNKQIEKRSSGRLKGFFLISADSANSSVLEYTLPAAQEDISAFTEELIRELKARGAADRTALVTAVACEELCVYTSEQDKKNRQDIDIRIRFKNRKISVCFCSIGRAFSPIALGTEEFGSNLYVLNKLAEKIEYDYILGMNQTHILL